MPVTLNINPQTIVVQTAAQWAVDATVYINRQILITSDVFYTGTDQRKFKIADGSQTWTSLDYFDPYAYSDSKVADAINDGVATIAPSQNAVFDALALKPKLEIMFGTTTVFSPADSTTTYTGIPTNLAVNAVASTRAFQGISGTIYYVWLFVDPQSVLGSTELVTINLRNITDSASSLLGTIPFDVRGRSSFTAVASPITFDDTKFYAIELVFPAWVTNPQNVAFLGKLIIR